MTTSNAITTTNNLQRKQKKQGQNESFKYGGGISATRGFSNPSSRPRSQLGATQTQQQHFLMQSVGANMANNYASLMATSNPAVNHHQSMLGGAHSSSSASNKYKYGGGGT